MCNNEVIQISGYLNRAVRSKEEAFSEAAYTACMQHDRNRLNEIIELAHDENIPLTFERVRR